MLQAFWLVLKDLWNFIFSLENTQVTNSEDIEIVNPPDYLPPRSLYKVIAPPPAFPALANRVSTSTANTSEDFLSQPKSLAEPFIMYVLSLPGAKLLTQPRLEFDGVLGLIPYGQSVTVKAFFGAYAKVATARGEGYLHKDSLTPGQSDIWPKFKSGLVYDSSTTETNLARILIGDEFLAGALSLPFQAGEYILLRSLRDRHRLSWPAKRPRQIGLWHQILRGQNQVKIGVDPKADTIMEWIADDGIGRLAYVEAVLADQTIRLSAIGLMVAGEYSELSITQSVWREWRPVFISVIA